MNDWLPTVRRASQVASVVAALALVAATSPGCGSGAGSGLPCAVDTDCVPGEVCLLLSCEATEKTCQVLCEVDTDCTGGLDSSPSGAVCLPADTEACPVGGQQPIARYCAE